MMRRNERLCALFDHLAEVLDEKRGADVEALHRRALGWEPVDRLPVIMTMPDPAELTFQPYPVSETFDDPEKMLFNELVYAFNTSIASRDVLSDDLPITIRANFGTVVMASLFGAHVEQVAENPPWVRHGDGRDVPLEAVLDCDPLDFSQGWCSRVVERYRFYQHRLSDHPELAGMMHVVLPDLQGPFDNLELIVGSDVFMDLYTNPEGVARALNQLATAQVGFVKHLEPYVNEPGGGFSHQHATMIKGNILLRNDSVIMMSPEMYRDVVAPHDERVMEARGGGGIHSCGNVDAHVPEYIALPSMRCLDLGQSELNDVDALYRQLSQRRIPLTRLKASKRDLATGRIMDRFPTGVSLLYEADSLLDARETMDAYRRAAEQGGVARGGALPEWGMRFSSQPRCGNRPT